MLPSLPTQSDLFSLTSSTPSRQQRWKRSSKLYYIPTASSEMAQPHSEATELHLSPQTSTSATLHDVPPQIKKNGKRRPGCSIFHGLKWLASCLLAPYDNFFDAMSQVNQYEGNLCKPLKRTYNLSHRDTKRLVDGLNKEAGIRATLIRTMRLGREEQDLERGGYGTMDPAVERWRSEVYVELESLVSDDEEELTDSGYLV